MKKEMILLAVVAIMPYTILGIFYSRKVTNETSTFSTEIMAALWGWAVLFFWPITYPLWKRWKKAR
ncbi:MAG: hypothetical protein A2288_02870 [Candidatus Moranbacteria bacterium RIFOXYA12_FULL_44_15]|nr:MAG: hypothetical protein A2288_02870 [Candidatus Moranbacteria bacterium RIFOXYA12_FULL_44_15]OGI35468.1 MAG: hypothetical protein A2259_02475 [Candidatus Moranbacteria bacterium RIFOXYA2_FULL_43_15]